MVRGLFARCTLLVVLSMGLPEEVFADAGAQRRPVSCALDGMFRPLRARGVCSAIGRGLGREIELVDDARTVAQGDAVHLIYDDVQWAVIWLVDGRIRAWTRVSKAASVKEQLKLLAAAARALAEAAPREPRTCVRLDPNAGHEMRSDDLTYPWAELAPCPRRWVEVVDPWWVPPKGSTKK